MKRLSRGVLLFAVLSAFFFLLLVTLRVPLPFYPLMNWQDGALLGLAGLLLRPLDTEGMLQVQPGAIPGFAIPGWMLYAVRARPISGSVCRFCFQRDGRRGFYLSVPPELANRVRWALKGAEVPFPPAA